MTNREDEPDGLVPVNSLDEIPSFANEDEEHEFWTTHSFGPGLLEQMRPGFLEGEMTLIEDAKALAAISPKVMVQDLAGDADLACYACGNHEWDVSPHTPDCAWIAMPRIVKALEAAQAFLPLAARASDEVDRGGDPCQSEEYAGAHQALEAAMQDD